VLVSGGQGGGDLPAEAEGARLPHGELQQQQRGRHLTVRALHSQDPQLGDFARDRQHVAHDLRANRLAQLLLAHEQ